MRKANAKIAWIARKILKLLERISESKSKELKWGGSVKCLGDSNYWSNLVVWVEADEENSFKWWPIEYFIVSERLNGAKSSESTNMREIIEIWQTIIASSPPSLFEKSPIIADNKPIATIA